MKRNRQPFSQVYHVGFLDDGLPDRSFSLEGNGLSVSECPEEWETIAQLGGRDLYLLSKEDPNFYMAHESGKEKALEWCVETGYLVSKKKYRAYISDEDGEEQYFELDSSKRAEEESEDVREVDGYSFGPKGKKYWTESFKLKLDNSQAEGFSVVFYAEAHGYDGVWWNDDLDVGRLSAPRGVIFQHKLSEWKIKKAS
jgi:hypothetical protein